MLHGHGGDVYSLARELGRDPARILDFSSNVSPLPFPAGLRRVLTGHIDEIRFLPEVDSLTLREALGRRYGLPPGSFLVGAGTTEWIHALPRVIRPGKVVISVPTYADYGDAARAAGCPVELVGPWMDGSGALNGRELDALEGSATDGSLVFVCNPNNPTGRFFAPEDLIRIMKRRAGAIWVVDESYAPFIAPDSLSSILPALPGNAVVLRSFSKIYGVPGLRLGYAAGGCELIGRLAPWARPWAVGRLAQVAGEHLLGMVDHEDAVRGFCRTEKARLLSLLGEFGFLAPHAGHTHFILFAVAPPWRASTLAGSLRRHGILIRDCGNFEGLSGDFVRIALRSREDNDTLVEVLGRIGYPGPQ